MLDKWPKRSVAQSLPATIHAPAATEVSQRCRRGAFVMATVALASLLRLRLTGENPLWLYGEFLVSFVGSLALYRFSSRQLRSHGLHHRISNGTLIGVSGLILWPWLMKLIVQNFEAGGGFELLLMASLANGSLLLAATSRKSRLIGMSVVAGGFLTLFTTCISDQITAVTFAFAWAILCLWWLVTNHWEKLEMCPANVIQQDKLLRPVTILVGTGIFAIAAWTVSGMVDSSRKLTWEIMPTSGGTKWSDESANSGVNDGDALTAAKDHASAFGPVDSDLFLDSKEPSLFDLFSETMGEPIKRTRSEKAIALTPQQVQEEECEQRSADSKQSSQTLTTRRQAPKKSRHLSDRRSDALFFWIGRVGIRLAVERFAHYDGETWSSLNKLPHDKQSSAPSAMPPAIASQQIGDRLWFLRQENPPLNSRLFVGGLSEALKFTNFDSPRIPVPAGNKLWHIDLVDREDFFAISQDGSLEMSGRQKVPDYTVIRLVNQEIDREQLESLAKSAKGAPFPLTREPTKGELAARQLANSWIEHSVPGWSEIDRVIQGLRSEFQFSRETDTSQTQDPLAMFLEHRIGNDLMFSTAAAIMLRDLGYTTRLVTGFYVDPGHHDALAGQTIIARQDTHAWVEIQLHDQTWIPLEPTPGYLPPQYHVSWTYQAKQALPFALGLVLVGSGLSGFAWWSRKTILELCAKILWWVGLSLSDRRRVSLLLWVLDQRARFAKSRRPPGAVPRSWYLRNPPGNDPQLGSALRTVFNEADRLCFGDSQRLSQEARLAIQHVWRCMTTKCIEQTQLPQANS